MKVLNYPVLGIFFLSAVTLISGRAAAKETYVACSFERASQAASKPIKGCNYASCAAFKDGLEACKCLDDKSSRIQINRGATALTDFAAPSFIGDTGDFEVLRGSLASVQNTPLPVLIVANRDGETNGIPFSKWTVTIVDENTMRVLNQFPVAEYGPGIFARKKQSDQARGCDVLETAWADFREGLDKPGTYYTGNWFQWDTVKKELVQVPDRPTMRRRLLRSFEREWWRTYKNHGGSAADIPLRWLQSPQAEEIPKLP